MTSEDRFEAGEERGGEEKKTSAAGVGGRGDGGQVW